MDEQLKKLVESARHFRSPDYICQFAARMLVPLRRFKYNVWAQTNVGPLQLDRIFLGLLENDITSRKGIAARLGINEDEFIFSHLDELVHRGYVADDGNSYSLTPIGEGFLRGNIRERRMEKKTFSFVWGNMSQRVEPKGIVADKSAKGKKLTLDSSLNDDDMIDTLAKCFNKDENSVKHKLVFYDAEFIHATLVHAEYVALFYAPKKGGEPIVDLRIPDKDDKNNFRPCEDISDKANNEKHWREQFGKIWQNHNNGIPGKADKK